MITDKCLTYQPEALVNKLPRLYRNASGKTRAFFFLEQRVALKRAVIYIRVSSVAQTEGVSMKEQERECREHLERKGYELVEVYQDVGSATSLKKRPEFQQIIQDAQVGKFDVLIAWREDRLYRGYLDTGFIDLMRLVESEQIKIELVTEHFDQTMAVIKAAMAKEENKARVERTNLGIKARLRAGKPWGIEKKYGYALSEDGEAVKNEIEADWIVKMFQWYLEGVGVRPMSRRLISEGAPMKISKKTNARWPPPVIYRILKDETFATGIHKVKRGGEVFDIPVPQIVDPKIFHAVQEGIEKNRSHPVRNVKHNYLLSGLLMCPCGVKWNAYSRHRDNLYGYKPGTYPVTYSNYRCSRVTNTSKKEHRHPKCTGTKGVVRLDKKVWDKVSEIIRDPNLLKEAAQEKFNELKSQHKDAAARRRMLEDQLGKLEAERDAYIEQFGKGTFSEQDLERALSRVSGEELEIKQELVQFALLADTNLGGLDQLVNVHMENIRAAAEWLDNEPATEEEKERQFQERKAITHALVERVYLERDKEPRIDFVLDLSEILQIKSQSA